MKKLFKILSLILAINVFASSHSSAWEFPLPRPTYNSELAKIVSILYKSGTNIGCLALKDSKNLINKKMIPFIVNNDYLLATSIMLSAAYTIYLIQSPKSTVKKTFIYGLSPAWYPVYYAWKKLRQEDKIKNKNKKIETSNQVNSGNL